MAARPSRADLLELDVDLRLAALWAEAQVDEPWTLERAAIFMRAAYGKGYCDALREPEHQRGALCHEHGYQPPRQSA